ncbi:type I-E CRISPR-associated endonuclease Cas1 [Acidithiobacillus ferrivorans]|nr:type I-E CRISPR-associated endonuclease Cas1 [Acidithiobacillus ferrivorans]
MPISGRLDFLFVERCRVEVEDGVPVVVSVANDEELMTPIPAARLAVLMLAPGTSVTHGAIVALARMGCLLLWTGEHGVRIYSAGKPGGAIGQHLQKQALLLADPVFRLAAARRLYKVMMGKDPPQGRSVDQLRGLEGVWVREAYARLSDEHGVIWPGRNQKSLDTVNQAISQATSTLYGISEAVILAMGLSPAIGIVHAGSDRSLVFDLADTVKFVTVVPVAFRVAAENPGMPGRDLSGVVRRACRDLFVREKLLERLVTICKHVVFDDALDSH